MNDDTQQLVNEITTSIETSNDNQELVNKMDDSHELVDEIQLEDEMDDSQKPAVVVDEWVMEIEGRLGKRSPIDSNIEKLPSIFGKWQHWDDFGTSYIPETQKWMLVACMTHYFGLNVRSYLVYMQQKVDKAWSYYQEVHDKFRTAENTKRFIEHLLVNSCFFIFSMILLSGKNGPTSKRWSEIINKDNPKGLSNNGIQTIEDMIL